MGNLTKWPAPAKINLFLRINGRRADGYHELETLFAILNYGDTLTFSIRNDLNFNIYPDTGIPLKDNLIFKAALALMEQTNKKFGCDVTIDKKIPMGGGLGGGSSDAATVLYALNKIMHFNIDTDTLATIGRKLGADVPVFIRGNSALAEGVGEILTPVDIDEKYYLVATPANTHVSTKEIFQKEDLPRNSPKLGLDKIFSFPFVNDCENLVKKYYPEVARTLSWLVKYAPSRMTGTGASCFAEFSTKEAAETALSELPEGINGFVAKSCRKSPLLFIQYHG